MLALVQEDCLDIGLERYFPKTRLNFRKTSHTSWTVEAEIRVVLASIKEAPSSSILEQ